MQESKEEIIEFSVPEGVSRERADKVLARAFREFSRSRLQQAFEIGQVLLDDVPIAKKYKISTGDTLLFQVPELEEIQIFAADLPLDIVFEDDDLVVLNKAAGQVVHPGNGTGDDTLCHALLHHCSGKLSRQGGALRPGVVHRLDKATSGLIVFAKTDTAYQSLTRQFAERETIKHYIALVSVEPELDSGSIKLPIGRHKTHRTKMQVREDGRFAHTDWEKRGKQGGWTMLHCRIHTGRTHQIRVHLSHAGFPILGDYVYGYRDEVDREIPLSRFYLHASYLSLSHPKSGERVSFESGPPDDFYALSQ